jgi:diguanylate cyclase (GGDEF)-like protein/PAS domain S-box-containing protein
MDWNRIQHNWKLFRHKIEQLMLRLTEALLTGLITGSVDDNVKSRIGQQIELLGSSRTRHHALGIAVAGSDEYPAHAVHAATTVLLVEQEPATSGLIEAGLAEAQGDAFRVERVTELKDALRRLSVGGVDIVMLDLTIADSPGFEVLDQVLKAAPDTLVFVLAKAADEELARRAVQRGAYDYFLKDHVDSRWLSRTLRYVIDSKTIREALQRSEARFRAISDASPLGIFVSDTGGSCIYTNAAYQRISGLSFKQTLGTRWSMAIHPEDRQRVIDSWRTAAQRDAPFRAEFRFQRQDGSVVWTRVNSAVMHDGMMPRGHVQTVEDVTERKLTEFGLRRAEEELFQEKERAQVTLNSIGDAVLCTDTQGSVTYLNKVAETMTGWSGEEALGRPFSEVFRIINGETRERAVNPAQRALTEDTIVGLAADCVLVRRDGTEAAIEDSAAPIHDRNGNVSGAVIVFHDVSQSRAMASKMEHQAKHDFLTGLPNRAQLMERLSQAIGLARRHDKQVALMFLDLDNFKHVNDTLGHAIGDRLLQSVSERLQKNVRSTDMVCRHGGDEFVILLDEIENPQGAELVAETLITAFSDPHVIDGEELDVTLSIGISVYPDDGDSEDTLISSADTAMFHAKAGGRNIYQFYSTDMNINLTHRLAVQNRLHRALRESEFKLYYQPQINLVTGAITGAEALIRWQDPELGLIYPDQFIAIAEECRLIVTIGRWALREACRQVRSWQTAGLHIVPVTVNVSAMEFRQAGFLDSVTQILRETGLAPAMLELELTETMLMHDAESSASVLSALKNMGVRLAIDDFGTGYSSLSYLKRFPIDTLKIDQSFVRDIIKDSDGATIVAAVIGLGKNLKQRVIAEGVETSEQLAFLRDQNCEEGQGFHFCHAVPADAFRQLLETEARH